MAFTHPLARALFEPRSIALIGASADPAKNTARPQIYLRKHGYRGALYPVNPGRSEVLGEPAFARVEAIPGPVDHALIMVPAEGVLAALEGCARKGISVVTVYSDGFTEAGPEGQAMQQALVARARELGVRLLGPNSIGMINVAGQVPLSVNAALACDTLTAGRVAFVSQSGTMLGTVLSRGQARGLGFSRMISVGNESDLAVGEITRLLVDDPQTDVILLFLETLRDAPALADAARAAHRAGKSIAVFKLGRSEVGAQLAVSHTGALAGSDAACDAFFREHGIVRVQLLETLLEIAPLLVRAGAAPSVAQPARRVGPPRVAVVSTTGGGAAMVVDSLGLRGVEVVGPTPGFIADMAAQGITLRAAPIIDLTLAATPARYEAVLRGLLAADFCDAVLAVAGTSAQFHPQLAVQPIARAAVDACKPLAAFLAPQADASLALLAAQGIAAFRTPEACADALAAVLLRQAPRAESAADPALAAALARWLPAPGAGPHAGPHAGAAGRAGEPAAARVLDEPTSLAVFEALGVPVARRVVLRQAPWTHAVPYPVAAKLVSADLPHKTEAGAVSLGVADDAALGAAVQAMHESALRYAPRARIDGVLVQAMHRGVVEALVGYRHDALVGPIVVLGAGGRLTELMRDVCLRLAPLDLAGAHAMIESVAALAPLRGYRGMAGGDVAALADALVAVSRLALLPGQPVAEAEINPLIVERAGAVAVDGLMVMRDGPPSSN
ncbi:MAG: acetate--CoA ligase family protein [Burkholderiaceae bacterium]|nr:acetate--CoA ligase family protein [Burkholderiaceae bacterium]